MPTPRPQSSIPEDLRRSVSLALDYLETFDRWHQVGAADEAAFQNGWGNIGTGSSTTAFRRDAAGNVYLRGELTSAAAAGTGNNTVAFTLPPGYRHDQTVRYTAHGTSGVGGVTITVVQVAANGDVNLQIVGVANNAQASVRLGTLTWRPVQ